MYFPPYYRQPHFDEGCLWDESTIETQPQRISSTALKCQKRPIKRHPMWPRQYFTTNIQREAQSEVKKKTKTMLYCPIFNSNLFKIMWILITMSAEVKTEIDTFNRMDNFVVRPRFSFCRSVTFSKSNFHETFVLSSLFNIFLPVFVSKPVIVVHVGEYKAAAAVKRLQVVFEVDIRQPSREETNEDSPHELTLAPSTGQSESDRTLSGLRGGAVGGGRAPTCLTFIVHQSLSHQVSGGQTRNYF